MFPTADAALGRMKASYACVNGLQGSAKVTSFRNKARFAGTLSCWLSTQTACASTL